MSPKRNIAVAAALVALTCATLMFWALRHRDSAVFVHPQETGVSSQPTNKDRSSAPSAPASQLPDTATSKPISIPAADNPKESFKRTFFKLKPSRRFQPIGSFSVRLSRLSLTKSDFDLSFRVNGRRLDKKHVGLNQPITLEAAGIYPGVQIVFEGMTKNQLSGYVTQ